MSKDGQVSAAWRTPGWALALMVALLCLNIYVLTWEAAGQGDVIGLGLPLGLVIPFSV